MTSHDEIPPRRRWLAGCEFLLGAFIVIGHNVFRILPNEVPILVALGLLSNRLWTGSWRSTWRLSGLGRPASWSRIVLIALAAAGLRLVLGEFVLDPLTARFWPRPIAPAEAAGITGNLSSALLALLIVWTFAAFGEEFRIAAICCRGLPRSVAAPRHCSGGGGVGPLRLRALLQGARGSSTPRGGADPGRRTCCRDGTAGADSGHGLIDTVGVVILFFGWDS
jgi:hypothetical protein